MTGQKARPRGRKLGQHFLFDPGILNRMADAADAREGDCVLEVGPGLGTLTECLAGRGCRVAAVELDGALMPGLRERLGGRSNVTLLQGDILKTDLVAIWREHFDERPFKLVANLPYYITTPVIMLFLTCGLPVVSLTVMVQKEVADRLASPPGSRQYGAVSVAAQFRSVVTKAFTVPAGAFSPPPNVQSAVLHMAVREKPAVAVADAALFERTVRGCFTSRRKTLRNNVSATFGVPGDEAERLLRAAGLDPSDRAERLGLPQFAALANALAAAGHTGKEETGVYGFD